MISIGLRTASSISAMVRESKEGIPLMEYKREKQTIPKWDYWRKYSKICCSA